MEGIKREDIEIIRKHSNLSEKTTRQLLEQEVYNNRSEWEKFLRLFFVALSISFTAAGVLFFFAYNWDDLHKFVKLALIEGVLILTTAIALISKLENDFKNILLTGSAILVGVLFAVFGQVYQTGANAYDLFLGWTVFITLWVLVSQFAPLWLLYIALINTTLVLYSQQVAWHWDETLIFTILFILNATFLVLFLFAKYKNLLFKPPIWFTNTLALASVCSSTIGICIGIFAPKELSFYVLGGVAFLVYVAAIKYALTAKSSFFFSIIPFSLIIIISAWLLEISDRESMFFPGNSSMFFFVSLFIIVSVTLLIKTLIYQNKKWTK